MILSDFSDRLTTTTTGVCNALDEFAKTMAGAEDAAAARRESAEIERIREVLIDREYERHNVSPNQGIWDKVSHFVKKMKERNPNP